MIRHEITLYLHAETDRAWMVNESPLHGNPPTAHVWLPKSQCTEVRRSAVRHEGREGVIGTQITLDAPEWLITKNELDGLVA